MKTEDKVLQGKCSSALWQIQGEAEATSADAPKPTPPSYQEATASAASAQVMISYQWDVQQRAIKIRENLKAAGYKVWMDLTNMRK